MDYFIILFTFVWIASGEKEVDYELCAKILTSHSYCCMKPLHNTTSLINDDLKECDLIPRESGSCDRALCFGTKLGFATADGVIKMSKLEKHIEEKMSEHKDIFTAVKNNCFDGRYKLFGGPDDCDLNNISECVRWQYVFKCPNFSTEEACKDIKDVAAQCFDLQS